MSIYTPAEFLKELKKKPENFYVIHYSCQNLFENDEELSPQITSIAVSHFATDQTKSFSTHAVAEALKIPKANVAERFPEVEKKLLDEFYEFVRDRRDKYWVHWNMRNLTYGFEHLEHRYRVLDGGNPPVIPVERRINLNDVVARKYGSNFAKHPKQKSLMEMNGGLHRHFLTGEEEVEAFKAGDFIRMHNSTLVKVGFFRQVLLKLLKGKLKTATNGIGVTIDRIFEHRAARIVGAAATLISVGVAIWQIAIWALPTEPVPPPTETPLATPSEQPYTPPV